MQTKTHWNRGVLDTHILTTFKSNRGVLGLLHRLEASWALVVCHDWWICRGKVEDGCATLNQTNISWQIFPSQRSVEVSAGARRWSKWSEATAVKAKAQSKQPTLHFRLLRMMGEVCLTTHVTRVATAATTSSLDGASTANNYSSYRGPKGRLNSTE